MCRSESGENSDEVLVELNDPEEMLEDTILNENGSDFDALSVSLSASDILDEVASQSTHSDSIVHIESDEEIEEEAETKDRKVEPVLTFILNDKFILRMPSSITCLKSCKIFK